MYSLYIAIVVRLLFIEDFATEPHCTKPIYMMKFSLDTGGHFLAVEVDNIGQTTLERIITDYRPRLSSSEISLGLGGCRVFDSQHVVLDVLV